jgi:hypothetical protein
MAGASSKVERPGRASVRNGQRGQEACLQFLEFVPFASEREARMDGPTRQRANDTGTETREPQFFLLSISPPDRIRRTSLKEHKHWSLESLLGQDFGEFSLATSNSLCG